MFSFRRVGAVLVALALAAGCNTKKEAPPPPSGIPPLDQPMNNAAVPSDHPVHEPATAEPGAAPGAANDKLPPGHPPVANAMPPGHPPVAGNEGSGSSMFQGATPGDVDFDPKTVLAGVIKVDAKVKDAVKEGDTIFLVARQFDPSGVQGPPLAVRKLTVGKFPLPFSLDSRDAMLAGTKLAGKVVVTARVDKDGDAMTKNPGDVTGQSKAVVPPSSKVEVNLDKIL
jgi:hypothetical protein